MAGKTRFYPKASGIRALTYTGEAQAWALITATAVELMAKQKAPVRTGAYRDGIRATTVLTDRGWCGRVIGTDRKSRWLELGTVHNKKYRTLGKSLDAVRRAAK